MPTTKTVQVTCGPDPNDSSKTIITSVVPFTVDLHVTDSVIWQVSGLTSDQSVFFDFNLPGDNAPDGLFRSVSTDLVTIEGALITEVTGDSFKPPDVTQSPYHYGITVQDSSGAILVRRDDPQIDNLGPPPQG